MNMTTFKVRRLSRGGLDRIIRGLKRSWQPGGAHRLRQQAREPDADDLRRRALYDRRGTEYATIVMDGNRFVLLWSAAGRTDQVDVFLDGVLLATIRPSAALQACERLASNPIRRHHALPESDLGQ